MTSLKEKQVDKFLDKIIGGGDDALRVVTKLALMNKELTPEIVETIEMLRNQNAEDAKSINEELSMTLDASGNLVPIIGNSSYSAKLTPYEPILTQERAGENVVCPITYTILSEKVDVIDCANNVVYRLPLGKT